MASNRSMTNQGHFGFSAKPEKNAWLAFWNTLSPKFQLSENPDGKEIQRRGFLSGGHHARIARRVAAGPCFRKMRLFRETGGLRIGESQPQLKSPFPVGRGHPFQEGVLESRFIDPLSPRILLSVPARCGEGIRRCETALRKPFGKMIQCARYWLLCGRGVRACLTCLLRRTGVLSYPIIHYASNCSDPPRIS